MKRMLALLGMVVCVATALVRAYSVEPRTALESGWTRLPPAPNYYVSQTVTCNFDSVKYVELFAGAMLTGQKYKVDVYELPGGTNRIAYNDGEQATKPEAWVRLPLTTVPGKSFTRGKQYEFKFTRSGSDSIQYYYQGGNPYPWGYLKRSGTDEPGLDLCMRVYGVMRLVEPEYFGMIPGAYPEPHLLGKWKERLQEAGTKSALLDVYWNQIQPTGPGQWDFSSFDTKLGYLYDTLGCRILARVQLTPKWASTRITLLQGDPGHYDTSEYCAPRNLWAWPDTAIDAPNYWARFIDTLVKRAGDRIHAWEIWNEPNDTNPQPGTGQTGWWRRPNTHYTTGPGLRPLCSLYVRMCEIATDVIKRCTTNGDHRQDRILIGNTSHISWEDAGRGIVKGVDFVNCCYQIAEGRVFWDGVSVHPYQNWAQHSRFNPWYYEDDAQVMREMMRRNGHNGELWNTEFGGPAAGSNQVEQDYANSLCAAFVTSKASEAEPAGGFDAFYWYCLRDRPGGLWGLLDDSMIAPRAGFYAYKQLIPSLAGLRLNGRMLARDPTTDSLVRVYEFEDPASLKKTWVAWKNDLPLAGTTPLALPVRTDAVEWEPVAYGPDSERESDTTGSNGWFHALLGTRPMFVFEPGTATISRPDLAVDSVAVWPVRPRVGRPFRLTARVKNNGMRATPAGETTWVRFYWNDSLFATRYIADAIDSGATYVMVDTGVVGAIVPGWMLGAGLLTARANPDQAYVEKEGLDDNAAYLRTRCVVSP